MVYQQIKDGKIPMGNFTFIYDVTANESLFYKFYDAERNLKLDYMDFAHKMRMAFEAFALEEESKRRKTKEEYVNVELEKIKEDILDEIKKPASILNYKNIIIDLCDGRESEFKEMLVKYSFCRRNPYNDVLIRKFKAFIRFLYAFGSESSHENIKADARYMPTRDNCFRVVCSFHDFLCIYYGISKKYDRNIIPIRDYTPVPKNIVDRIGMTLDVGKSLFIKEKKGKLGFYIFSNDDEGISDGQRRDIDIISKLWDDNFGDPSNVIRQVESINSSNGDYRFQVYLLPGYPLRLTDDFLNTLSMKDRLDIIVGLCRGVESLHTYEPPVYHRNINPDAFYIFQIKGKYKPLLAKFDCAKDSDNAAFTVYQNVEKKALNQDTNSFFAPEVISSKMGVGVDWKKADIYSLAKTIAYILIGRIIVNNEELESHTDINDELLLVLMEMLDINPQKRAELSDLITVLGE